MKRMLFNATQQEELRVAIVNGQKLIDIDIETTGREQRKSNIYKGIITRIEPSLEACFVNYGEERHGFLPFKEVARTYFREGVDVRTASIKDALREGQEIVVQVEKEERGNKGAALTSFISLAGRYLVLMPNNPRGGGVSRRVEGEDRQELRETMDKLDLPSGMSVIARTAGIGRNVEELQWDLNYLMQLWRAIEGAGQTAPGAFLIYQESSLVIRAIRDYFQPDIGEILIDTDDIYEQAQQFMSHVMPDMVHRVKRYRDDVPLFSRFQIEHQIETAYSRTVPLPSGGAIVIDHTEALVSIDVNSARATRGSDIETTAFNTNCEAADEVARQLRLRDLGGLIVIDFIDMENAKNQREVETRLKDSLRHDRARVQMGKISRFGLMELSRQRLRPSLSEGSHVTCPRCNGTGHIRDTESSALQVLRIIQEEAMKENSAAIHVQAPVDVAAFLLNEKRGEILKIETRHRVLVILIPNKHLETPHYKLERIKHDDPRLEDAQASYMMAEEAETDIGYSKRQKEEVRPRQEAMVKGITPDQPAPIVERKPIEAAPAPTPVLVTPPAEEGFLSRMFGFFRRKPLTPPVTPAPIAEVKPPQARTNGERTDRNGRGRNRGRGRGPRDRSEGETEVVARSDNRQDASKQAAPVSSSTAPAQRAPRPPRDQQQKEQQKEQRESRDVREAREPREQREPRETAEARRERQNAERAERQRQRDEQNEVIADAVNTVPLAQGSDLSFETETVPAQQAETAEEIEVGGEQGEERPRRRRRGGRNRNRRDRDSVEGQESGAEANGQELAETAQGQPAQTAVQLELTETTVVESSVVSNDDVQPVSQAKAEAATPAVHNADLTAADDQAAAPQVDAAPLGEVAPAVEPAERTEPAEPQSSDVKQTTEQAASAIAADRTTEEATGSEPTTAHAATVTPPVATEPAPASSEAPALVQTSTPDAAPPASASAPSAAVTPAPVRPDQLQEILAAAGLTLAVTDPEKLRAAQEANAQVASAPAPRRERRVTPPPVAEPLVQVETRR